MGIRGKVEATSAACAAAAAVWLALAPPASSSSDMETLLQDEPKIVYEDDPAKLDETLGVISGLGVDTIRVLLYWHLVAPSPTSRRTPDFGPDGPADPASYPVDRWRRYDRIVKLADKHGLNVLFSLSGPAPRWATRSRRRNINNTRPDPRAFGAFATAVGRRYSGSYPDPDAPPPPPASTDPPLPVATPAPGDPEPRPTLPRVGRWSMWNEPNFPSWLNPQRRRRGRRGALLPASPTLYRRLVEAGYAGLAATGHADDVILIGETAPRGAGMRPRQRPLEKTMAPLVFLRELYCLNGRYQPYRGRSARRRGCPSTAASRGRFVALHPGLFKATGWAHHPYSVTHAPTWRHPSRNVVTLGSMYRLTRALDRVFFRWGQFDRRPVYITEYGYETRPDPFRGIPFGRQARWMSWAEYIAFRNPRIHSFAQFLLVDDAPWTRYRRRDRRRWITWQSGLFSTDGDPKPSLDEFPRPLHVTPARARRGRAARVFGVLRPAPYDVPIAAAIQFTRTGGDWEDLASLTVANARGYLLARVRPPGTGWIRIAWTDPVDGSEVVTRAQRVIRR